MMGGLTRDVATITTIIVLDAIAKGHILVPMAICTEPTARRHGVCHDVGRILVSSISEDSLFSYYLDKREYNVEMMI